jgi:hypothetical protein
MAQHYFEYIAEVKKKFESIDKRFFGRKEWDQAVQHPALRQGDLNGRKLGVNHGDEVRQQLARFNAFPGTA